MFITHAINPQKVTKAETPNRKIKNIMTNKIQVNNHSLNKIPSNQKLLLNNKENQNPNIKKSPSQEKEKSSIQLQAHQRAKQNRVKSQYYSSNLNNTKQSPIKKILFVKNLCYKSTKTSKNSSLDNKNQQPAGTSQQKEKHQSLNHQIQRNASFDKQAFQRKSYSHGNKGFIENQSQIFQESKPIEKSIPQFRANDNVFHNQSQASYRMAIIPNELHPKMAQFNEKYSTYPNQNQNYIQNQNQNQNKLGMTKMNSFDCGISSATSQNLYGKHNINNKMCPNIQSSDLSELQSFKKNNFIFPQHKRQNSKALISMDKEKKESLSSKKRNSRIKITYKNPEKFKESFNQDLVTQQSQMTISSPSHPIFSQKMKLNNSQILESERDSKSSMSKNVFQESTLLQTKKIQNSLNLSDQFSRITLNESKQSNKSGSIEKKHDQKRYCVNHPQKQARFRLNKQIQRPFYCEKCSAYLVTKQGYEVMERLETQSIKTQIQKTNRLQKLKNFIFSMQIMEPKLEKSKTNIRSLEQQVNIIIKKGQQEIQKYYKKLHETLDSHKEGTIKALHFHSQKTLLEISMLKKSLHQNEGELSFMKSDILPNIDLIVNEDNLPDQSFKQIIMMHEQKLGSIDSLILRVSNLVEGKQHKIIVKTVQIPLNELKSALNALERTQIVFVDKVVKIQLRETNSGTQHFQSFREENSPDNEAKKDFSFDDQNIDSSFYVPSSKKKPRNESPVTAENFYELTDSIRLSFGNRFEASPSSMRSPTFKVI